jgi:hypothetical protein
LPNSLDDRFCLPPARPEFRFSDIFLAEGNRQLEAAAVFSGSANTHRLGNRKSE